MNGATYHHIPMVFLLPEQYRSVILRVENVRISICPGLPAASFSDGGFAYLLSPACHVKLPHSRYAGFLEENGKGARPSP